MRSTRVASLAKRGDTVRAGLDRGFLCGLVHALAPDSNAAVGLPDRFKPRKGTRSWHSEAFPKALDFEFGGLLFLGLFSYGRPRPILGKRRDGWANRNLNAAAIARIRQDDREAV
jgi:hypothetical protein